MNDNNLSKEKKGWVFLLNSGKAHYFDNDSRSMCQIWMFTGDLHDDKHDHPDNCKICMKKRDEKYGVA